MLLFSVLLAGAQESAPGREVEFYAEVRPILAVHCHKCHAGDAAKGGLNLETREAALKGGDSGPALVPGRAPESLLWQRVASKVRKERMPAKAEALPGEEQQILRRWLEQGASWPAPAEAAARHWAFRPPTRPVVPDTQHKSWVRTPVDAFIAAEHERRGLSPAPEAGRRTLLRRLSLDLCGLPPSPEELAGFLADAAPDAVERAVERLLASPRYGERWGRHWLDFARFAETTGYEGNTIRASAWRYRDYVVKSLNDDKPYDRFLREQIAGDELDPASDEQLVATGFLAHGRLDNNQEDRPAQRNDHLVDIVNATAAVTLGVSFGCTQCHAHKWDPFTHEDYYRFMGFFVRGQVVNLKLEDPVAWEAHRQTAPPELAATIEYRQKLVDALRKALKPGTPAGSDEQVRKGAGAEDQKLLQELDKKIERIEKARPDPPQTWGFYGPHTGSNALKTYPIQGQFPMPYDPDLLKVARPRLLKRGDPHQPGAALEPGWPEVFGKTPPDLGSRRNPRSALVDWLTKPEHPLTARVFVNFVWGRHFGRGLVETPADFGLRGARPSHPELLDWLATEFIREGWSLKALQRRIVLSSTYRQAARSDPAAEAVDPRNRLLWRWTPRRLEAEALRDSLLVLSGELDPVLGGPSVEELPRPAKSESYVKQPPQVVNPFRRALYFTQRRHEFPALQALFDGPQAGESCPQRHVSTVALQPLYLLNNPFAVDRAKAFAERIRKEAGTEPGPQVEAAFERALSRPPSPAERNDAVDFLAKGSLEHFVQALMNLNEFVYVE